MGNRVDIVTVRYQGRQLGMNPLPIDDPSRVRRPSRIKHGTKNAYQYHNCRCAECRAAYAKYHQEYRKRTKRKAPR